MNGRALAVMVLALLLAVFAGSCEKEKNHGSASDVDQSECLPGDDDSADDDSAGDDAAADDDTGPAGYSEALALDWDGLDLRVTHGPACWNCGFDVDVQMTVSAGLLEVREFNGGDEQARCSCLFEYKYTLSAIPAGQYQFRMRIEDGDPIFEETIVLPGDGGEHYDFSREVTAACE
jgi:hypothetical protein